MDATTLGVKIGYAVEATAGTRPTTGYIQIPRCQSIPEIKLDTATIDATCLEDKVKKYQKGQQDSGGKWEPVFYSDAMDEIETMRTAAETAAAANKGVWWVVWFPDLSKSYFVKAQPDEVQSLSEVGQAAMVQLKISCVLNEIHGFDTKVEPTVTGA